MKKQKSCRKLKYASKSNNTNLRKDKHDESKDIEVCNKNICISCTGLEYKNVGIQAPFYRKIITLFQPIDTYLLNSSDADVNIVSIHSADVTKAFESPVINTRLMCDKYTTNDISNIIVNYLEAGRKILLSANIDSNFTFDNCVRDITAISTEFDNNVIQQYKLELDKNKPKLLNKIQLARLLESVTNINGVINHGIQFCFGSNSNLTTINQSRKLVAKDLLGGNIIDDNIVTVELTPETLKMQNIEKRLNFLHDGSFVPGFIIDKKFIELHKLGKIDYNINTKLIAEAVTERSPLSVKSVVYYLNNVTVVNK